jgi:hypothetical protein
MRVETAKGTRTVKGTRTAKGTGTGLLPKTKDTLINRLEPLISQVTNDVDLQHFLISIYDETSNDEYTKSLFGGKTAQRIGTLRPRPK